ncbi:MAG TPA: efflux RND transporter periplasmic adaptor subunit [Myxococcota bacterium]|nr:efflux RND transporter periplasmic adaptor subunit [Myxococcota bacterium]
MIRKVASWTWFSVAFLVVAASCGSREGGPSAGGSPPSVSVVRPERGAMTRSITLPGDLVGLYESALHAKVTGYLKSIRVDKGDWVKKGEVLAEIEVPELEQKLQRARANLAVRRGTYERLHRVWETDKRLVAREDVDIAQGQFEEAKAEVEELEALVGYTHIVAPFDGVVTARFVDPGALIQASGHGGSSEMEGSSPGKGNNVPIVTVSDIDTLRVYVYVPEEETSLIKAGIPVTLRLREFPGREFKASVTRFATALDLSTRTMLVEADIENSKHELYPGMYADVLIELARHDGALKLPASAVGGSGEASFVYIVREGRLAKLPVTVGFTNDGWVEIASGLSGDESVVGTVTPALTEGESVRAVLTESVPAKLATSK